MRKSIAFTVVLIVLLLAIIAVMLIAFTLPSEAFAETLSRTETRKLVTQAAKHHHLPASDRRWLRAAAVDIIYTGAHESGGSTHAGRGCVGLLQFDRGWHANRTERRIARKAGHRADWRLSGRASIYRFVRVYKQGGKPAIRRHWAATLGR